MLKRFVWRLCWLLGAFGVLIPLAFAQTRPNVSPENIDDWLSSVETIAEMNAIYESQPLRGVSLRDIAKYGKRVDPVLKEVSKAVEDYFHVHRRIAEKKLKHRSASIEEEFLFLQKNGKRSHENPALSLVVYSEVSKKLLVDISGRHLVYFKGNSKNFGFVRVLFDIELTEVTVEDVNSNGVVVDKILRKIVVTGHKVINQRGFDDLSPELRVSLKERMAVLSDSKTGFTRVWPAGVGSIDTVQYPGKITLMTPIVEGAMLHAWHVEPVRSVPKYFNDQPFIPLMIKTGRQDDEGNDLFQRTDIAFHILSDQMRDSKFIRGFDSHGCMRLRKQDLKELLNMVIAITPNKPPRETPKENIIRVSIQIKQIDQYEHPFPMAREVQKSWRRVKGYKIPSEFQTRLSQCELAAKKIPDEKHEPESDDNPALTVTESVKYSAELPQLEKLEGIPLLPRREVHRLKRSGELNQCLLPKN